MNKRFHIIIGILTFVYAICAVLGSNYLKYDTCDYKYVDNIVKLFVYWIGFWIIGELLALFLVYLKKKGLLEGIGIEWKSKKMFVVIGVVIFLAWLPAYIACFPGLVVYDGPIQAASLSRHHPIFHTLFVQLCVKLANILRFCEWKHIYCLVQLLVMDLFFTYFIEKLVKWGVAKFYILMWIIFLALYPMNVLMALATTKDTLFAGIFTAWIIEYYELIKNDKEYLRSKRVLGYIILMLLVCGFRKNGIYVVGAVSLITLIYIKSMRLKFALISLGIIAAFALFEGPVLTQVGLPKGDSREALSIIIQPVARAYNVPAVKQAMSEDEEQEILNLFGGSPWYVSHISDPPKSQFNTQVFKDNLAYYMKWYIKNGLKYPSVYMDAYGDLTFGNWYPFDEFPDKTCYRFYFEFPETTPKEFGSSLPGVYSFLQDFSRNSTSEKYGIITSIFSSGMAFWIMLAELMYGLYKRRGSIIMLTLALFMMWGTIMLGPVALFRYTYPIILSNGIIIGLILNDFTKED